MDDVRIQIVNYKTKKYLIECLTTLVEDLRGTKLAYTIAILDNASGDDLTDIPRMFPNAHIEISKSEKNGGFGYGHNILARSGEARYLLILNPDTKITEPHTLERLVSSAEHLKAQVVGPRLVNGEGKVQHWDYGGLHGWKAQIALRSGGSYWKESDRLIEAAWVSGAAFLIEKEWFDRLGGFDENFFLYKEEEELCWRLRAEGGHVFYNPGITILHYGGVVAKKADHIQHSTKYFLRKHFKKRPGYYVTTLLEWLVNRF